jgi:hypothetical protein
MPYEEFLKTPEWHRTSKWAKDRYGEHCMSAGCSRREGLEVHHDTYERRGCERLGDLAVFCHPCHGRFHGLPQGRS